MKLQHSKRLGLALVLICLTTGCYANDSFVDVPASGTNPEVAPFQVQRHEVTIAQYNACVADGGCPAWAAPAPDDMTAAPSQYDPARLGSTDVKYASPDLSGSATADYARLLSSDDRDAVPITFIPVSHAAQFCAWVGGHLPDRLERREMIRAFAAGDADRYRDQMLDGDQDGICQTANLPHHDARVLIEQLGSQAPQDRISDKVVRVCETGPSITATDTGLPTHLIGSVNEWTLRQADGPFAFAAGGSWMNGEFVFEGGFDSQITDTALRAIDVGFRCAKPR